MRHRHTPVIHHSEGRGRRTAEISRSTSTKQGQGSSYLKPKGEKQKQLPGLATEICTELSCTGLLRDHSPALGNEAADDPVHTQSLHPPSSAIKNLLQVGWCMSHALSTYPGGRSERVLEFWANLGYTVPPVLTEPLSLYWPAACEVSVMQRWCYLAVDRLVT